MKASRFKLLANAIVDYFVDDHTHNNYVVKNVILRLLSDGTLECRLEDDSNGTEEYMFATVNGTYTLKAVARVEAELARMPLY